MAVVKPFRCIHPAKGFEKQVASLPYDVYSRTEARQAVAGRPYSFLNIDRPETQFPEDVDMYSSEVYQKAGGMLEEWLKNGIFTEEKTEYYYIYQLTMNGRSQTGLAACCWIDDYLCGVIKRHECTREEKEQDRIRHVDRVNAHTGPVFLTYRQDSRISGLIKEAVQAKPMYDFVSEDGISQKVWKIEDRKLAGQIEEAFQTVSSTYIADGHHRAASAVKVGLKRRRENPAHTGREPYNYFLAVLFPDEELQILSYNRVVKDLNGLSKEEFLERIGDSFEVKLCRKEDGPFSPVRKGQFGMFLEDRWYELTAKEHILSSDPVKGLDASILQDYLLDPVLGIKDPRTDSRIDFIGGIRGLQELEWRTRTDMKAAFSMYPTSMDELLKVADAGLLMPPKSTWFEPKLYSGLFIHRLTD